MRAYDVIITASCKLRVHAVDESEAEVKAKMMLDIDPDQLLGEAKIFEVEEYIPLCKKCGGRIDMSRGYYNRSKVDGIFCETCGRDLPIPSGSFQL